MTRLIKTLCILVSLSFLSGCISLSNGPRQQVNISSDPSGALAEIHGEKCLTPCTIFLKRSSDVTTLYLTPDGQPTQSHTVIPAIKDKWWHEPVALLEGYTIILALIELSLNDFLYNWPADIHVTYIPEAKTGNVLSAKAL
jgi:hypothetical protein